MKGNSLCSNHYTVLGICPRLRVELSRLFRSASNFGPAGPKLATGSGPAGPKYLIPHVLFWSHDSHPFVKCPCLQIGAIDLQVLTLS